MSDIIKPVEGGVITCDFTCHKNRGQKGSFGYDIAHPNHDEEIKVVLMTDSMIIDAGLSETFGNRVWAKCLSGKYKDLYFVYPHLDSIDPEIKIGAKLQAGIDVGIMGNTGLIMVGGKIVKNNDKHIPIEDSRHTHIECRKLFVDGKTSVEIPELEDLYK